MDLLVLANMRPKLSAGFQPSRFLHSRRSNHLGWAARALPLVLVLWSAAFAPVASRGEIRSEAQGSLRAADATHPTIVFMTDFGSNNDAVPICKGVMLGIVPDLRIVDLTHEVKPYSILDGARFLYGATPYFPAGTVFVAVVDPGVGSTRKAVAAKSKRGQYFVVPDNGLLTLVADRDGLESAREITNPAWMIGRALSSTFHGRDIFSPAAAHLARGDDWTGVGPQLDLTRLVRLEIPASKLDEKGVSGAILALDEPFGSLISNIDGEDFEKAGYSHGDRVGVTLGSLKIVVPFVKTFSDVAVGRPLLYIDSRGHLALAVNQGNFSKLYHVKPVSSIFIPRKSTEGGK